MSARRTQTEKAAAVLRLVPRTAGGRISADSEEVVEVLEALLAKARQGRLVGIAYCGLLADEGFMAEVGGEARRRPTFARGMVAALDDKLSDMVHGR